MTTDELVSRYADKRIDVERERLPLNISSRVLRIPSERLVVIGSEANEKDHITAFADAVHWYRQTLNDGEPFHFRYFRDDSAIAEAIGTLKDALSQTVPIEVWLGETRPPLSLPHFSTNTAKRLAELNRDGQTLPPVALQLQKLVGSPCFRWYRTVTGNCYSGRIDGLEVCTVDLTGSGGNISVGNTGRNGAVGVERAFFLRCSKGLQAVPFREANLSAAADILKQLADARQNGELRECQPEHRLESRVLRGDLPVVVKDLGALVPVISVDACPFQFPAQWSSDGNNRYIDALMRFGDTPWVVEIKDCLSRGQYLRHAVAQVVLYRQYVRRADQLHPWFVQRKLVPARCQAAVAFPRLTGDDAAVLRSHVEELADLFDVRVIELND